MPPGIVCSPRTSLHTSLRSSPTCTKYTVQAMSARCSWYEFVHQPPSDNYMQHSVVLVLFSLSPFSLKRRDITTVDSFVEASSYY